MLMPMRSGDRYRNRDAHLKAGSSVPGRDFALMQQNGPAGDGEAEADTSHCAVSRFIHTKEGIKDAANQVFRYAGAVVANVDLDSTVTVVDSHLYARTRRRKPDRVAQHIFYSAA